MISIKKISYLLLAIALLFAAPLWAESGNGNSGFTALKGSEAANFRVPTDLHLTRTLNMKARGLVSKRYQQMLGDAEVLGGQLTVISSDTGETLSVIGAHYPNLMSSNEVKLKGGAAQGVAATKIGGQGKWHTRLMIDPSNGRFFYNVENQRHDSRWFHWIDAEDGSIINAYDGLTTGKGGGVEGASTSTLGVGSDTKDLTGLTILDGSYVLKYEDVDGDVVRPRQSTYDAKGKNRLPGTQATDDDDLWFTPGRTSPGQAAMVDAHFFAYVTDDYFINTHNFNWTDHFPQGMVSSAHVKRNYNNAFWNGSQMAYGDGDGVNFRELSGDLDVVGHELAHGVTEATSNLIYQNESGALNEAFSDIMGSSIEFSHGTGNWTIGENIDIKGDGFRNMANPNADGDPSHYKDRYTGTSDNGGVHINSGIANHWYYLLVNGGQNAKVARASGTDVSGVGVAAAEQIAFHGFTNLNATADFCDARAATVTFAADSESEVNAAWDEVGVTASMCAGGGDGGSTGGGAPVISNVESTSQKGTRFEISWSTDIPSTTEVTFSCCGTYTKTELVTNHKYGFRGSNGITYTYFVTSDDGNGNSTTDGPHTHQN